MMSSIVYILQCHNQENAPKIVATYKKANLRAKILLKKRLQSSTKQLIKTRWLYLNVNNTNTM